MGWGTSFGSDLWHALNLCLSCGYVTPRVTPFAQTHPSSHPPPEESVHREGWCAGREEGRGGRAQGKGWRRSWAPVSRCPRPHHYAHPYGVSEACCGIIALWNRILHHPIHTWPRLS